MSEVKNRGFQELPKERMSSLDETGRRVFVQPASVEGIWKSRRVIFQSILLAIFLVLPWIRINGLQSLLIDIPARRFALFGVAFWAHDTPLLLLILALFAFMIALVTVLWGRVWCGWACPQTVFIERVFRYVEVKIEGSHLKRRELDRMPWTRKKIWIRGTKWLLFLLLSMILAHSFLAYFVGVERLARMIRSNPSENWNAFLMMVSVTAVVLFNFGWFREQFCIIMCPYGKIQSLFTDQNTLTVTYDSRRGEPRKGYSIAAKSFGDCVNCFRCVNVCPTGIDIRRGSHQLECIGCTACMDACDDVMTKTKKPKGLIRYASDTTLKTQKPVSMFYALKKVKPLAFATLALTAGAVLAWNISMRQDLKVSALRAAETPYQVVKNAQGERRVINHFKIDVRNQSARDFQLKFRAPANQRLDMRMITAHPEYFVKAGETQRIDLFLEFSEIARPSDLNTNLVVSAHASSKSFDQPVQVRLISPTLSGVAP